MTKEMRLKQRLRDVDEAHGMIQEFGSRGSVRIYRKERLVIFKVEDVGGLEKKTVSCILLITYVIQSCDVTLI